MKRGLKTQAERTGPRKTAPQERLVLQVKEKW